MGGRDSFVSVFVCGIGALNSLVMYCVIYLYIVSTSNIIFII